MGRFSHLGEETDKDDELSPGATMHPWGLHTKGPAVTGVEEMLHAKEEVGIAVESAATLEHETVQNVRLFQGLKLF